MRSEWLQQQFPNIYQTFSQDHDLVVSVPHIFRWSSSITSGTNSPSIKQTLPIRLYAGITQTQLPGVTIGTCHVFNQVSASRNTYRMQQIIEETPEFAKITEQLLQKMGYKGGIHIDILTEVPRGQGFGLRGAFVSAIALALTTLVQTDDVLSSDASPRIQSKANKTTRYIAAILDMMALGRETYTHHLALCGYTEPIIYRGGTFPPEKLRDIFEHHHLFEAFEKYADLLEEHFENSYTPMSKITAVENTKLPFDYAIVFLGQHHASSRIRHSHQQLDQQNSCLRAIAHTLSGLVTQKDLDHLVQFDTTNIGNYHTFQQIAQLFQVLTAPYDKRHVTQRIQSVVDAGWMHSLIEKEHHLLTEIYHLYAHYTHSDSTIGLVPLSSAKRGGCVLMVMPYEEGRNAFDAMIHHLQPDYPQLSVHHLSRRDGGATLGPHIHQFISHAHFGDKNKPGTVLLREAGGRKKILPYTELKTLHFAGIVLDNITGKVILNGKKLTHKDLITQSGTIDVLTKLLDHPGEYVHHAEFPMSSYTRNKNEMIGKVVTPLKELIKKHYDIEIPLSCDGTTYDFHICLEHDAGIFHVVQKPFASVPSSKQKVTV